jgi:hypothetical protein
MLLDALPAYLSGTWASTTASEPSSLVSIRAVMIRGDIIKARSWTLWIRLNRGILDNIENRERPGDPLLELEY